MPSSFVSVVMSTHNYGHFIADTIESLLGQSYAHFEVIIVDDASTDNTLEVIEQYDDDRIVLLRRSECSCSGVFARNDGLVVARGDLIAVADADDVYVPDRLEKQVAFLETSPQVDLLGGTMIQMDRSGKPLGSSLKRPLFDKPEMYRQTLLTGKSVLIHSTLMFRRHILDRVRGYGPYASAGDFEFMLRASRYFRFSNLKDVLGYRRVHGKSISWTYGLRLNVHHRQLFLKEEFEWVMNELRRLEACLD